MATMTEPQVKTLIQYRAEDGLAIIELDDPPANTYTYEMIASSTTRSCKRASTTMCT